MADGTHIEWTDATWNVTTGCTKVSPGCDHCYIERTPPLRMAGRRFDKPGVGGTTGVLVHPDRLTLPLRWRKPRRIFVNSLSDLFHADVPDDVIARVFAVMAATPQHTFQILTKRHARMRSLLNSPRFYVSVVRTAQTEYGVTPDWPLPNVWLGVSVEDQSWAETRIPPLLDTPAAVRWISAEPLLGPVDLEPWLHGTPRLDWVVGGGESGAGARPMHPEWARCVRMACDVAGVPFLFKQAGTVLAREWGARGKGGNPLEWPEAFPREYPHV